jgi:tetratricopeptide (TPR) repeat protein
MKKKKSIVLFITLIATFLFTCIKFDVGVSASENLNTPYYTFTADSLGRLVRTTDAYTPSNQITGANGESFSQIEHVFVDENNYIYITDSTEKRVYILNENYEYITMIDMSRRGRLPIEVDLPMSSFVTKDKIYVVDSRNGKKIIVFDKIELLNNGNVVILNEIGKPTAPIFNEGENPYPFNPQNIVVDPRGYIYVQGSNSQNGLMMLDEDGNFLTFFAGNPLRIPFVEQIRSLFLTEEQEKVLRTTKQKAFTDAPTNIALDAKGYIYTVTSSLENNPVKKFNVSGTNYFKNNMIGTLNMSSIAIGRYNNVFAVNSSGYIFEYDSTGNLLFVFGGKDSTSNRIGLLNTPVSVAINDRDEIIVIDQAQKLIQIYEPTIFTNNVHEALNEYQKGNYEKSLEKWQFILQYNSLFDYAHIGLGDSYLRNNQFDDAYREYKFAGYYEGISDSFWGIRQEWMKDNLTTVIITIIFLGLLYFIYLIIRSKYDLQNKINNLLKILRGKSKIFDDLMYIFTFLKHPFNGFYYIKMKRISILSSTIIYLLLAWLFILNYQFTNEIFVPKIGVNIAYELLIVVMIVVLGIISNYLICTINDGEGSFKNVYNATAYSLTPILVIMPIIIIISNLITYQEQVFYDFGNTLMTVWVVFLLFFMIKDIHNYEVKQTIGIIFKSMFTMLIMGLMLFIINALSSQMISIFSEIITEVSNR